MLWWAFVFLGTAIIASLRDFGGAASTAADVAEVLSFVFLIGFVVCVVTGLISRPPPARDPDDAGEAAAKHPGEARPGRAA